MTSIVLDHSSRRAQDYVETLTRSLFQLHGYPVPDAATVDQIVRQAAGLNGLHGLHHPESVTTSLIGQIDQLVLSAGEANRRPVNLYSAEAARQAHKGDGERKGKHRDFADPLNLSLSSARFQEIVAAGRYSGLSVSASGGDTPLKTSADVYWGSPAGLATTRSYALNNDMAWATKQPDLMRLGQPAIQALHEAKLKSDGYDKLHSPAHMNFDNPTIVAGAGFMKRNHLDYDEAAKAAARVYDHRSMTPEEKAKWRKAVGGVLHSDNDKSDELHKADLRRTGSNIEKAHPEMTPDVDRALKRFGADKGSALKADLKADDKEAAAKDATAKMAELLKKRKAAQAGPQPPH